MSDQVPVPTVAQEPVERLLRDLRTSAGGLSAREVELRLAAAGPNTLTHRGGRRWPAQLLKQFTQPLALLLVAAGLLALGNGTTPLALAIFGVVVLNAVFAFLQERHAEHAVAALASYLPVRATVVRDGRPGEIDAVGIVAGDVLVVEEGDRISADGRVVSGAVDVDLSTLTGESEPVSRGPVPDPATVPLLQAADMVFSGSACVGGEAHVVVTATGMRTEIGRIAALSQRDKVTASPLEEQIRDVARLISVVAVVASLAFLPLGLVAGLSLSSALSFAIGMLVANVPEGLLPTITLALAVGVRRLARQGAVVKRLSAVETLGSTTVVCTDKTGTLTRNSMRAEAVWTFAGRAEADGEGLTWSPDEPAAVAAGTRLAVAAATCSTATVTGQEEVGDPTEVALVRLAERLGAPLDAAARDEHRRQLFRFDPRLRRMATVEADGGGLVVHVKGAPEAVLPLCTRRPDRDGGLRALSPADLARLQGDLDRYAARGLRLLAVAERPLAAGDGTTDRTSVESGLTLLGCVALHDPPRPEVAAAIGRAHQAGIRIHVVTGDNGTTAAEVAREVGIGTGSAGTTTVTGDALDAMTDHELEALLGSGREVVFARTSPEAKLRIADRLKEGGDVVAMTGDGVNDAPALRAADIGVAMGRSGTEVARQAATIVLEDDNFTTIVDAVEEGRRVYDNVRKFIFYILSHSVPEVVPFVLYALSGGAVPLPITVMQLLAIDLVTDTLPALALSREPAEPGLMQRPPRPRSEGVIRGSLLWRAWGLVGIVSALLVLGGFFTVLVQGGWAFHDPTGPGTPLHETYVQATTVAWLGIVACQVGTATAARTQRASLRSIGFFSNPLLLWAIGAELVLTAAIIYVPAFQRVFDTTALPAWQVALVLPFPVLVWGVDEARRWRDRRRGTRAPRARPRGGRA
ncbi:cation-transporting P-type ATPase [Nocardioides panacis]|uniref:Cation-transporting P-type ATPase n=1 Tax=Nocardioides panacis TaxID=2849501 RepID=A0A975SZQ4_9ACTN|nr:cation-transporting P-type ATPase [Nocardioides panacis]QWZ08836.1 cation-transporting P-type ATPase [Nocardioides panacis]